MARRKSPEFSRPLHEPQLSRSERRATGVYYTPPEIVRQIVDLTLGPLVREGVQSRPYELRILDPACGAGEFLVEAHRRLSDCYGCQAANRSLFGIDIDASAIATAQGRLPDLQPGNLLVADALTSNAFPSASFDAIIGNPPYVNIRQLAKTLPPARIAEFRKRFRTARGNFDLYVLFIERALELLRPGGRCGLIIPNKWAALDYARSCRELLLEQATIEQVIDLSGSRAFTGANVYPHILVLRKEKASSPGLLSPDGFTLTHSLDVESRVATSRLGAVAKLSCGTAGFSAQRIARRLLDVQDTWQSEVPNLADFITSGNIDRYTIRLGNAHYLNHTYVRPRLPLGVAELTPAKQRLFASPKIVIAGMSRRLEAAWDADGLALGVQVFAASEFQVDPHYLLALLNSKLLSYLFATRFAAKRLSGGYLAINKGQLTQLPIVVGTLRVPLAGKRLAELAKLQCHEANNDSYDGEADRLVYDLYHLKTAEIDEVEGYFATPLARAA